MYLVSESRIYPIAHGQPKLTKAANIIIYIGLLHLKKVLSEIKCGSLRKKKGYLLIIFHHGLYFFPVRLVNDAIFRY